MFELKKQKREFIYIVNLYMFLYMLLLFFSVPTKIHGVVWPNNNNEIIKKNP